MYIGTYIDSKTVISEYVYEICKLCIKYVNSHIHAYVYRTYIDV